MQTHIERFPTNDATRKTFSRRTDGVVSNGCTFRNVAIDQTHDSGWAGLRALTNLQKSDLRREAEKEMTPVMISSFRVRAPSKDQWTCLSDGAEGTFCRDFSLRRHG
jgi:hypothetical protein